MHQIRKMLLVILGFFFSYLKLLKNHVGSYRPTTDPLQTVSWFSDWSDWSDWLNKPLPKYIKEKRGKTLVRLNNLRNKPDFRAVH